MNRLLVTAQELMPDNTVCLQDYRALHLLNVLKVEVGSTCRAGIIDGASALASVLKIDNKHVQLKFSKFNNSADLPAWDLLLALPRPKVLKRLLPQLAALGVGRILLTNAEKVENNYFATHWLSPENYQPLLINGLEQSGKTKLPKLGIHRKFRPLLEDIVDKEYASEARLLAHLRTEQRAVPDINTDRLGCKLIAIGPEGGWSRFEIDLMSKLHFKTFSISDSVLRSDTACIAVLAVLNYIEHARPPMQANA